MVGGLLFTSFSSANFGQNAKSWRLFADYINNVGITLDLLAPLSQSLFLPLICLSSVFKSLCGIAAGAAGAVISEHWGSIHGNIAEVNSKNGAQHTAISLLGLLVSIPFASFASRSPRVMWTVYAILTAIHVVSNYCAMRTLCLRTLNISRGQMLVSQFLTTFDHIIKSSYSSSPVTNSHTASIQQILADESVIASYTLKNIALREPILKLLLPRFGFGFGFGTNRKKLPITGVHIIDTTTATTSSTVSTHGTVRLWAAPGEVARYLLHTKAIHSFEAFEKMLQRSCDIGKNYTLFYHRDISSQSANQANDQVFVCFSDMCAPNAIDQLEALLSAQLLLRFRGNVDLSEVAVTSLFPLLLSTLKSHGWDTNRIMFRPRNARAYAIKNV